MALPALLVSPPRWNQRGYSRAGRPWRLPVINAHQETALCCLYSPIADETSHRTMPLPPAGEASACWRSWGRLDVEPFSEGQQYWCVKFRRIKSIHVKWSALYFALCLSWYTSVLPLLPTYILASEMYAHQLHLAAKYFKCYYN